MSDVPQGPGWWQASDGRYYPPEQFPGAAPTPPETPPEVPPAQPPTMPVAPAPGTPPPPGAMIGGAPPPGVGGAPGAPPSSSSSSGCVKALVVVAVLFAFLGLGTFLLVAFVFDRAANELEDLAGDVEEMQQIAEETGIQSSSRNTTNPPQADIALESCEVNDSTTFEGRVEVTATGTIENHSSKTSDYWVLVSFRDDGVDVASDFVSLDNVDADQVVDWTATSSSVTAEGDLTCKIVQIERWEAGLTPPDIVTEGG